MGNFDVLPDSIAILVLSKLENAQMVAQCAVVCHRWNMLTKLVDTLNFESFKLLEKKVRLIMHFPSWPENFSLSVFF